MTQLLPFVVFGVSFFCINCIYSTLLILILVPYGAGVFQIGLDDAFVIMGAYSRTDPLLDVSERVHITMEEIGTSITLTTLTSMLAFGLGCLASIPAVLWLCLYAIPTIAFVYLYQITFFVGAIVLDQKRVSEDRRDKCNCFASKKIAEENERTANPTPNIIERFIEWYADFLLKPVIKVAVILAFTALLSLCAWSASRLSQAFDVADVMPSDSYVTDFLTAREDYSTRSPVAPYAYFRYVDQSSPEIQEQMKTFVAELGELDAIPSSPPFFWLIDFELFVSANPNTVGQLPFNEQLDEFLSLDRYKILYEPDIIRDPTSGDILASRVRIFMDGVVVGEVDQEIDALEGQSNISARQPVNRGRDDYAFFTYDDIYQIWGKHFIVFTENRLYYDEYLCLIFVLFLVQNFIRPL